jgi:hypothetical protein
MTLDRRTVLLGVVAAAAVGAAAVATIASHRHHPSRERAAVSAYIVRANDIQKAMKAPLTRVLLAYRAFTRAGGPAPGVDAKLGAAAATLQRLERKLAAIDAPAEAAILRKRLLVLVGQEVAVTREVQAIAFFSPRYAAVLKDSQAASLRFGKALRAVVVPKPKKLRGTQAQMTEAQRAYQAAGDAAAAKQADAVDAYDAEVERILDELGRLDPPAALAGSYRGELRSLRDVAASGAQLSAELRKPNRSDVALLGRRLTIASRETRSLPAQRAQQASIRAYNRRVRAIGSATERVQSELRRLQHDLP